MRKLIIAVTLLISMTATTAMADSVANRLGASFRLGAMVPFNNDFVKGASSTTTSFAVGGGLMYSFSDLLAAEAEVLQVPKLDVKSGGTKAYEASVTDISMGLQFRFLTQKSIVPYLALGPDFIAADLKHVNGATYSLDWTYGGHAGIGADWFVTPGIAFNLDLKAVYAADGDILSGGTTVGKYRPQWFQSTVGLRMFLPEKF